MLISKLGILTVKRVLILVLELIKLIQLIVVNSHQGPPDQVRRAQISVTNTEEKPLNFKIRTTGPKFYTIQPNGVRIDPGQTNTFTISLYPGKYCLTSHKFSITVNKALFTKFYHNVLRSHRQKVLQLKLAKCTNFKVLSKMNSRSVQQEILR